MGLAAALALFGAMDIYRNARQVKDDYQMTARLERYAGLAEAIPTGVRELGYLTDAPYGADTGGQLLFFTAQYALTPRLLIDKASGVEWVLANFKQPPQDWPATAASKGLKLERDLGNGVALLRKAQP